ncbi:MAG TPA: fasciclin domain-containing protein [Pseudonocardiaceae bacterium]|nr:fasciclin domain-containing protein [Pseudonocardiaceae bacterium]
MIELRKIQRLAAAGALAAVSAMGAACTSSQEPATGNQAASPAVDAAAPADEAVAPASSGVTKIGDIFGPACDRVPRDGAGSPQGMVNESVATAASHNPLLSSPDPAAATLVKAVTAANLVDILNDARGLTVFAPYNPAFQALEAQHPGIFKDLTTAPDVTSPDSKLSKILTYHVVAQRYDAAGMVAAGTLDSMEGAKIKIGGTAAAPTVNGAPILCGNIPTKNATVFVIGQVLSLPAS